MVRSPSRLVGIGLLAMLGITALLAGGCSAEDPPPAAIREFKEPTNTVDALGDGGQSESGEAGVSVSEEAKRELEKQVEVLSVGYGADGAYLMVNFVAPPRLAILWQPGELYVVDQATGAKYADIPFMPKIGRLIGRPVQDGQAGYVMLQNKPTLRPGSKVTVVLGGFRQEGVTVEDVGFEVPAAP